VLTRLQSVLCIVLLAMLVIHTSMNPMRKLHDLACLNANSKAESSRRFKSSQVRSSQVKSGQVKTSQVKSSQAKKSSQVKSSQVKSSQVKKSSQVESGVPVVASPVPIPFWLNLYGDRDALSDIGGVPALKTYDRIRWAPSPGVCRFCTGQRYMHNVYRSYMATGELQAVVKGSSGQCTMVRQMAITTYTGGHAAPNSRSSRWNGLDREPTTLMGDSPRLSAYKRTSRVTPPEYLLNSSSFVTLKIYLLKILGNEFIRTPSLRIE